MKFDNPPPKDAIAALMDAAKQIADSARTASQRKAQDGLEIVIHCGDMRITIEQSAEIEAANAVTQAQLTSRF
jgi:uncharacterized ferredoxin-like protein